MKVAVIVARYGPDVLGGAEALARGFTLEAASRGWEVAVWTTCARSHYTWENDWPAGRQAWRGITVHRFPITHWDPDAYAGLDVRLRNAGSLPIEEQYAWLESGVHSAPLYAHAARRAADFDVIVALPYASPLVHYAAWAAPEGVVVWPCLHDEPYAYTEPTRLLLEGVWGTMFLSPEERALAVRRLGLRPCHEGVVGGGVDPAPAPGGVEPGQDLLYVGRLEEGKGLLALYDHVRRYADGGGDLRLVVLGGGPLSPPDHPAFDYRGFVSEEEKRLACATAMALCQPSVNESFSITLMESWLAGRPVLVHGGCPVTRGHVGRSSGGLWFRTYDEFVGAVEWMRANPGLASRMGRNGQRYVLENFGWEKVLDRFECLVRRWREARG